MKIHLLIAALLLAGFAQAATLTVCPNGCDYKDVQAAVYAAKNNDTIELQNGIYNESVHLTKELKFIGNVTGKGEPFVTGSLYTEGHRYSLRGFGFNSVQTYDDPYSVALNSVEYWIGMSDQYYSTKSYAKALEAISSALKIDPKNVIALNKKGVILNAQGRYDEALETLDTSSKIDPSCADLWVNVGYALGSQGKWDEAIQALNKAIELDPRLAQAWNNKGYAFYIQGKYDEALKAYEKAIEINPQYAEAWNNKGVSLNKQGKYDDAIKAFDKALELNPLNTGVWVNKGYTLRNSQRNVEADAAFSKAKELGYNS
jgi:tetratricopeptide (TPR) repeat protein